MTADVRAAHQANVSKPLQSDRAARWRTEMPAADVSAFEQVAGALLDELGYERGRAD